MARGQQNRANQVYGESQDIFNKSKGNVNNLFGTLSPLFQQEATNPQGLSAPDKAAFNTAGSQSVGGATAGAVGEGNLEAARTRNSAGYAPALDESVKSGERQLSNNALGTEKFNAGLKQHQSELGQRGLESLYNTNNSNLFSSLGMGDRAINTGIEAGKSGWFQQMLGMIEALKPGGSFGSGGNSVSFGG